MALVSDTFVQAGVTLFTRRGGGRGSRRAGVRSWVVLVFCSSSLRLIVFHMCSLSSGVFDWLRVCGLCMVWMDMLPADLAHACRICLWTSRVGLNLCVCDGCVHRAEILRK